jgi:hypothetical protein
MAPAPAPPAKRPGGHLRSQTLRIHHAADALLAARDELRGRVAPGDAALPGLYVARILAADDRHGAGLGLVVQGDAVSWGSLDALEVLVRYGQLAHHEAGPHTAGVTPLTCRLCQAIFALDVSFVDGLAAHRAEPPFPREGSVT